MNTPLIAAPEPIPALEYLLAWDPRSETNTADQSDASAATASCLALVIAKLDELLARQKAGAVQLADELAQQAGNLRQLDRLSEEFVERRVVAPLIKELLRVYVAVLALPQDAETKPLSESIESFFDSHEFKLIRPQVGEAFSPQQHLAIQRRATNDRQFHSQIARLFVPGLSNAKRVLQPARVAVFIVPETPTETNQ